MEPAIDTVDLDQGAETTYLQQMIAELSAKCEQASYADRRAHYLMEQDDYEVESEITAAMEEISANEKEQIQVLQVLKFLFDQNSQLLDQLHAAQQSQQQ